MDEGIESLPAIKYTTISFSTAQQFLTDQHMMMQQKIDGVRVTIVKTDNVKGYNKRREHISIPTWLEEAFLVLPNKTWIIDGELCKGSFHCFELFSAPGGRAGLRNYADRTTMLTALVVSMDNPRVRIPRIAYSTRSKAELLAELKVGGAEGVVFKSGRITPQQVHLSYKFKFVFTVDGVVLRKRVDGKAAIEVGVLKEGEWIPIGRCKVLEEIQDTMVPQQVVEVRYRKLSSKGKLIEPIFVRKRCDKKFYECVYEQLTRDGCSTTLPTSAQELLKLVGNEMETK